MPEQLSALFCPVDSPPTWPQACTYRSTSVLKDRVKQQLSSILLGFGWDRRMCLQPVVVAFCESCGLQPVCHERNKTALYMRSFHFSVRSVWRQNWCSAWKCLRALASLVTMSLWVGPSLLNVTPRYLACCSIVRGENFFPHPHCIRKAVLPRSALQHSHQERNATWLIPELQGAALMSRALQQICDS